MNGDFPIKLPPGRTTYSHVDAWDPVTGKRAWSMPYKYVLLASMLSTGGDLVFTGNPEGEFFALDARSGNKLWSFQTGAGHRGASVTYTVNGRQYIATTTGWQTSVVGGAFMENFATNIFIGVVIIVAVYFLAKIGGIFFLIYQDASFSNQKALYLILLPGHFLLRSNFFYPKEWGVEGIQLDFPAS